MIFIENVGHFSLRPFVFDSKRAHLELLEFCSKWRSMSFVPAEARVLSDSMGFMIYLESGETKRGVSPCHCHPYILCVLEEGEDPLGLECGPEIILMYIAACA